MPAHRYNITNVRSAEAKASILDRLFALQRVNLHPYGVDPVFLPTSELYDTRLGADDNSAKLYYNTSAAAGEVSSTGTPYGFFARPGLQVRLQDQARRCEVACCCHDQVRILHGHEAASACCSLPPAPSATCRATTMASPCCCLEA
jgi:hypothetical protein